MTSELHQKHNVIQIVDREAGRILAVDAHHVAQIIVAGVFNRRIDPFFGEAPVPTHVFHQFDLFFVGWLAPIDDAPAGTQTFDQHSVLMRHGTNTGGDFELWQKEVAPESHALRARDNQLPHDFTCPQAIRTKIPEEHYSTSYIAMRACELLKEREGNENPFFLMVSFLDPHHPFNPPGKYWDMYKPEDMPVPPAYTVNDWDPPEYIKIAERDRARDKSLGQNAGYSVAVSQREAQEAQALTCGMIAMVDDAIGDVRAAAQETSVADNTVQMFTSDHGDHLGDHRLLFKGAEQYDTLTHVPFIWADPTSEDGAKGTCSDELGQILDIGKTILEHAKIEAPVGMQGEVLTVAGGAGRDTVHIQYGNQRTQEAFGERPRVHTIAHGRWRLSMYLGKCQNELFNLKDDPGEMTNLWDREDHAAIKSGLIERLAEMKIAAANRVPLPTSQA